jgi:hypothetical protein
MPSDLREEDESRNFLGQMTILSVIGCAGILLYSARFWESGQFFRIFGVGMLVAGAALLSGFLLGFIFAIPRVGAKRKKASTTQEEDAHDADPGAQPGSVLHNGNLVEISDWLTKIIVGVGLVELHSIPGKLGEWSYYLASGLLPASCTGGASCAESLISGQAAGLAILIFYSTLGFLRGYVWTMIYFQGDLERKLKKAEREKEEERRQKEEERRQKEEEQRQKKEEHLQRRIASRLQWVETLISDKQFDKAMASIDEALRNDPQNALFVMTKARILKRLALQPGQPDKDNLLKQALLFIDQAIALLPEKGEPFYNKACYEALLDPMALKGDVLENLRIAFRLNPGLRQNARGDEDLILLREDADFIELVGRDKPPEA